MALFKLNKKKSDSKMRKKVLCTCNKFCQNYVNFHTKNTGTFYKKFKILLVIGGQ